MPLHEIPLERRTLHGHYSRDLPPVLHSGPGVGRALGLEIDRRIATEGMLDLMQREHGLRRDDAFALASVLVDLRVTRVVNGAQGFHAVLRDGAWR